MSITKRLILLLTLLVGLFWVSTALISRTVFVRELNEVISADLSSAALRMLPMASRIVAQQNSATSGMESGSENGDEPHALEEELGALKANANGMMAFQVRDASGRVLLHSYDADDYQFPTRVRDGYRDDQGLFTYTLTDSRTGVQLTVAEPSTHRRDAMAEATYALFLPLVLLVPLLAAAIWFVTRLVVAPVRNLRRDISERGGSNLAPIGAEGQPAELRPIARAVDRLMHRLKSALDAERIFAANAAHELRTPLAGALAQTQRLKEELEKDVDQTRINEVEATLKRLSNYTEKLLQLSRIDSGLAKRTTRTNMTPVLDIVLSEFTRKGTHAPEIQVENNLTQDLMVAMDADAFAMALRNLIENACLHGNPDTPVRLVIGTDWNIRVINHGPVVPQDELAHLKERFKRGQTAASGSGLGLSIVDRIMKDAGGRLVLTSPPEGAPDGFEAVLQLP